MTTWDYEKLMDDGKVKHCPQSDKDGSITGAFVFGLKSWFDENPQKARELGWIKHIHPDKPKYDKQTQFLMTRINVIDECTIEDVYTVVDKPEEMLLYEELGGTTDGIWIAGDIED